MYGWAVIKNTLLNPIPGEKLDNVLECRTQHRATKCWIIQQAYGSILPHLGL